MPTIMITGAGRGLGLEYTRQFMAEGWKVIVTIREMAAGKVFSRMKGELEIHVLDVNDHRAIDKLAADMDGTAVDVLLNNAGIMYTPKGDVPEGLDYSTFRHVMETNVMSPTKVTAAFLPHVKRSELKWIVTMSSKMGSMTDNTSGGSYVYRASKAAVNAIMKSYAEDLRSEGVTVAMVHPGWVRTDMGGPSGLIDVLESVTGLRKVITGLSINDTGKFFNYDGSLIPW